MRPHKTVFATIRAYAVTILWVAQEEMRTEKDSVIHPRKETHHAVA